VSGAGFGADHLPYGVVRPRAGGAPVVAVRYGDAVVPLDALELGVDPAVFRQSSLNAFLALGREAWSSVRANLQVTIDAVPSLPLDTVECLLPVAPGDYVDFYSSIEHASNLGKMFRPDAEPLLPNWRWLPVGYHGRSSSVVVSGTEIRRPHGQRPPAGDGEAPTHGPTTRLDIELELGFVTGPGNALGEPIPAGEAAEHIFGFGLVNDWSARDIQRWEYVPLGPFLGKSFATSLAAWITPLKALEPYRVANAKQDPAPLDYLRVAEDWALDIDLEIELNGTVVSRTNARTLYWNAAQQLAHATANGCNVRPGDLYASGTISGSDPGTYGSFIELTWGGRDPMELAGGETRTFLEDGDTVVLRGSAGGGAVVLGEVAGTIVP
jgi:fumarylacetoacetase